MQDEQEDRYKSFRRHAQHTGLIVEEPGMDRYDGPVFYFDLNQGAFRSPAKAEVVASLIMTAKMYARPENGSGEDIALLHLVAKRKIFSDKNPPYKSVTWRRPGHVDSDQNPEEWISLREWLHANEFQFDLATSTLVHTSAMP